jgi:hypothetical protein
MTKRIKILAAAGVAVAIALAVGLTLVFTSGGKSTPTATHQQYAELFANATVLRTKIAVLGSWPKPYQIYHDAYFHRCYEWWDRPLFLYNLCFDRTSGVLVNKELT